MRLRQQAAAKADDEQSRSPSPVGNSNRQQRGTAVGPKHQTAATLQTMKSAPSPFAAAALQPLLASIPPSPTVTAGSPTATDGNSSGRSQQHQGGAAAVTEKQRQQRQAAHDGVALLAAAMEAQSPDSHHHHHQQQQQRQEPDAATEAAADAADGDAGIPVDPTLLANFESALSTVMLRPVAVSEANDLRSDLEALTNFDIELVNKSRRGPVGSSSKFRGVTQHRRTRRWEAHIWDSKKQVYLGGFDNEVQAAKAHDVMAIKTRGPKTIINFKVVVYEGLLEWLCDSQLTKEATISALRKSSRRISSGKKRNRNSYTISPKSSPTTPRNHSSSSSGAAAAALQSLANSQLPPLHDAPGSAAMTTAKSRQHQGALDAALAAAAAAAAGISTSAAAAGGFGGREGGKGGSRSSSRGARCDAMGLGLLSGGISKQKGSGDRVPYIQVDSSGVVVNMPRSAPGILDLPAPPTSHSSGAGGPSLAGSGLGDLGRLGYSRGLGTSSSLGLSSGLGLSSSLGLSGLGAGLGYGLSDDDMMPQLPPASVLEAVLDRGGMFDHKFDHGLTGLDQGLGIGGGSSGLVGVTTFRACPGDALGLKGISSQGLSMLGLGGGALDPLGPHGVSRPSSLLLLQQRLQQQQQSMPAPPSAAAAAAAARQQALHAQQRQQQIQQQQLQQLQFQHQQQQMQIQHQLQLQQQRLQLQQQHLQQQQQHQQALSNAAAAAAAAGDAGSIPAASAGNLRDITSVHNPNNSSSSSKPVPATQLNTHLMGLAESDLVASDGLLISHADVAATSAAAAATADTAGVLVSSGLNTDSYAALAELECSMAAAASLPISASDLFFDNPITSSAAAAAAAMDYSKQLQHDPTGSMTVNNSVEGLAANPHHSNANTAIAAAAAAAVAAAEASAMMEASRAVQRELAIRREAGLALLMGGRVGKARV